MYHALTALVSRGIKKSKLIHVLVCAILLNKHALPVINFMVVHDAARIFSFNVVARHCAVFTEQAITFTIGSGGTAR